MMDVVKEEDAHIKGCSGKLLKSGREGRAARAARRRNMLVKMDGVHAAAAQILTQILWNMRRAEASFYRLLKSL